MRPVVVTFSCISSGDLQASGSTEGREGSWGEIRFAVYIKLVLRGKLPTSESLGRSGFEVTADGTRQYSALI